MTKTISNLICHNIHISKKHNKIQVGYTLTTSTPKPNMVKLSKDKDKQETLKEAGKKK